jgi:chaperone required for assembly of F1-ATPase
LSFTAISRRILNEIDKETKNPKLRDLAKILLQFEMENWGTDKEHFHYRDFYEREITVRSKKV